MAIKSEEAYQNKLARNRAWYLANKAKLSEQRKKTRSKKPEAYQSWQKEYRRRWPEKVSKWNRAGYAKARRTAAYKMLILQIKDKCKRRGIKFDLTAEWAAARWTGYCELTGLPFDTSVGERGGPRQMSPSIDRVEPSAGYTQANCRFVLMCINALKGAGNDADMLTVARALVTRHL